LRPRMEHHRSSSTRSWKPQNGTQQRPQPNPCPKQPNGIFVACTGGEAALPRLTEQDKPKSKRRGVGERIPCLPRQATTRGTTTSGGGGGDGGAGHGGPGSFWKGGRLRPSRAPSAARPRARGNSKEGFAFGFGDRRGQQRRIHRRGCLSTSRRHVCLADGWVRDASWPTCLLCLACCLGTPVVGWDWDEMCRARVGFCTRAGSGRLCGGGPGCQWVILEWIRARRG
jgi:hypothetical protein